MYGDLILADSQYGGNNGRRWKVDWNKAPQPVQIKLRCLRGLSFDQTYTSLLDQNKMRMSHDTLIPVSLESVRFFHVVAIH